MRDWNLPREGGCRCGQVRIKISAPPLVTMACHCTGCQKMSSSAFSLSAAIPSEGFAVTKGEPVIGGLHGATRHYFCPHCMSWMFTRPEGWTGSSTSAPPCWTIPRASRPLSKPGPVEKLAFAETGAVHSYETLPPDEAWEGLMKEYQEWVR